MSRASSCRRDKTRSRRCGSDAMPAVPRTAARAVGCPRRRRSQAYGGHTGGIERGKESAWAQHQCYATKEAASSTLLDYLVELADAFGGDCMPGHPTASPTPVRVDGEDARGHLPNPKDRQ